jgi:hypothetical protein
VAQQKCSVCGKTLKPDGECPDGCTDDEDYAVFSGFEADDDEIED